MRGKTDKELELCRRSLNLIERIIPEWHENPSNEEISRLTQDLRAFFAEEDKREQSPEEGEADWKDMTFREFIKDITKEMEENNWDMDKEVVFNTCDDLGLYYLSIYERDGKICIDVGDEDE